VSKGKKWVRMWETKMRLNCSSGGEARRFVIGAFGDNWK